MDCKHRMLHCSRGIHVCLVLVCVSVYMHAAVDVMYLILESSASTESREAQPTRAVVLVISVPRLPPRHPHSCPPSVFPSSGRLHIRAASLGPTRPILRHHRAVIDVTVQRSDSEGASIGGCLSLLPVTTFLRMPTRSSTHQKPVYC